MLDRFTIRHNRASLTRKDQQPIMFTGMKSLALNDEGGHLDVTMVQLGASGPRIARVQSTGHHIDLDEDGQAVLLLPQVGMLDSAIGRQVHQVRTGEGLLFGSNRRLTHVEGPFDALALTLPQASLGKSLAGSISLPDAVDVRPNALGLQRLYRLLSDIHELAFAPNEVPAAACRPGGLQVLVQDALTEMILARLLDDGPNRQPRSALERVLMAEEAMREHMAEPISMMDIAQLLGISLRSLQMAFREVRQMGPRDALNLIRLDAARRHLLKARQGDTVTFIALDCGVSHISRFASAYRSSYGEYPAETLAWAIRRAG